MTKIWRRITISLIVLVSLVFIGLWMKPHFINKPINNTPNKVGSVEPSKPSQDQLLLNKDFNVIAFSKNHQLKLEKVEKKTMYGVHDERYFLTIEKSANEEAGSAIVTFRKVPTNDVFVFVHVDSENANINLTLQQSFSGNSYEKRELDLPTSEVYPNRKEYTDPTSNNFTYLEFNDKDKKSGSVFIGGQYLFKKLTHTYPDTGRTSTVYGLLSEDRDFKYEQNNNHYNFSLTTNANQSSGESWYLMSRTPLFNNEDEFTLAQNIGIDEYKWLTPTDVISKGVDSIFPKPEIGFARSLVRQSAKKSIIAFEDINNRFFENINWNSFVQLEQIRDTDGLWYSNYTSTWLESTYGIRTHYVDSRHNDNLIRAQDRRAKNLGITEYKDSYKVYADFLNNKMDEGFVIKTVNGKFLVDYYSDESLTHVSLNHALSLMNYLYYAFQKSSDEKYLIAADQMYQALKDTGEAWINPEGNLFYQLNLDGTYQDNDYKLVTYYDLLYTRKLLQEIKGETSPIIEKLIDSKINYLEKAGVDINVDMEKIEDYVGIIE
ncbi:hypothetical protein [Neobacillus niacini]|uniref:hypothetical protein n=1 Tax=Neobacillus niacini TaxID=86668 RepID=UPI00203F720B|nr:hypothetical protein [Neobacillus niacini]MCM3691781.1 hypothetical protein [Neobacillus niacini]